MAHSSMATSVIQLHNRQQLLNLISSFLDLMYKRLDMVITRLNNSPISKNPGYPVVLCGYMHLPLIISRSLALLTDPRPVANAHGACATRWTK